MEATELLQCAIRSVFNRRGGKLPGSQHAIKASSGFDFIPLRVARQNTDPKEGGA